MSFVKFIPSPIKFAISGCLLGIGFVYHPLWPLSFFGIWLLLTTLESTTTWPARLGGVIVAFSIKSLCGIVWFWSVYPIDWLSIPVSTWQLPAIGLGWFVSGLSLGLGGLGLAAVVGLAQRFIPRPLLRYVVYALGWVAAEMLGSLLFSLVTYGEGGTITTAFSFGYIGYLSANLAPLFYTASIGGVYGVTIVTITLVLVTAYGIAHTKGIRRSFLFGVVTGVGVMSSLVPSTGSTKVIQLVSTRTTTVALIDTSFPSALRQQHDGIKLRQTALTEAFKAARASGAAYIIFPEDSGLTSGSDSHQAFAMLDFFYQLHADGIVVIDSGSISTSEGLFLRATVLDGKQGTSHLLDKQYLVPVGEFVPTYMIQPLFATFGWGSVFATLEQSVRYRPGPFVSLAPDLTHLPGILFCFEGVDPQSVKKIRAWEVPFIAHPFSHGWFQSTTRLTPQLTMMLRLQARANQISIVSAGNQGTGAVYLPSGQRYVPPVYAEGDRWRVRVATIPIVLLAE